MDSFNIEHFGYQLHFSVVKTSANFDAVYKNVFAQDKNNTRVFE